MKSLRSTGNATAARAARRCSGVPWKNFSSVRTDRHVAPPSRYARASVAGSKSGRISPPEGEAFLISAISPYLPRTVASFRAAPKPRGLSARAAMVWRSASTDVLDFRTATSLRVLAQMRRRTSGIKTGGGELGSSGIQPLVGSGRRRYAPHGFQGVKRGAGSDGTRGLVHAIAQIGGSAGDDQGGGGIQQDGVAIGAGGASQHPQQCVGVERGIAAFDRGDGRARQAGVLWGNGKGADRTVFQGRDLIFTGHGQFVQAETVHQPRGLVTQSGEGFGHGPGPVGRENAGQLPPHPRRVR